MPTALSTFGIKTQDSSIIIPLMGDPSSGYELVEFIPPIGKANIDLLRSDVPYKDETWDLTFQIVGSTAEQAYTRLNTLLKLLNYIDEAKANPHVNKPLLLYYIPKGSNIGGFAEYIAVVKSFLSFENSKTIEDAGHTFHIKGLRLKIVTTGGYQKLLGGETITQNTRSELVPYNMTFVTATNDYNQIGLADLSTDLPILEGSSGYYEYIFLANGSNKLSMNTVAPTYVSANSGAIVADPLGAGLNAPHNLQRETTTAANTWYPSQGNSVTFTQANLVLGNAIHIYALVRPNTNNTTYLLQPFLAKNNGAGVNTFTYGKIIPTQGGGIGARWVYLGIMAEGEAFNLRSTPTNVGLRVQSNTAGATIDILKMIVMSVDPYSQVFKIGPYPVNVPLGLTLRLTPNFNNYASLITRSSNAIQYAIPYEGNPSIVHKGNVLTYVINRPFLNAWRQTTTFSVSSYRYPYYSFPV